MIRRATASDMQPLSQLATTTYVAAFGHSMAASDLAAHLEGQLAPRQIERMIAHDMVLLAEINGQMVGFVQFGDLTHAANSVTTNADQEVRRLYVDSAFQNQGIGTLLLQTALEHPHLRDADRIFLDVWEQNHGARRLYERFGFKVIGERPFVVESGAETGCDLIMVRRADRSAIV